MKYPEMLAHRWESGLFSTPTIHEGVPWVVGVKRFHAWVPPEHVAYRGPARTTFEVLEAMPVGSCVRFLGFRCFGPIYDLYRAKGGRSLFQFHGSPGAVWVWRVG
jgi:hypothetical protein